MVTVISPLQWETLAGEAITPGHALQVREERKIATHADACHDVGLLFVPLVVETLGGWNQEAISTFEAIGRLQGHRLGTPPHETTNHLFQRDCRHCSVEGECFDVGDSQTLLPSQGGWADLTFLFIFNGALVIYELSIL